MTGDIPATFRRPPAIAAVAAIAISGAFLIGRSTAPAKVVERERVVTRTVEAESQRRQDAREAAQAEATRTFTVTRWVRRPDGTSETETRTEAAIEKRAEESSVRIEYRDRQVEVAVDRWRDRVVEAPGHRWALSALGGVGIDLAPQVGVQVSRTAGPLVLSVQVTSETRALRPVALLGLGVRW
jgi:hypothetical protein